MKFSIKSDFAPTGDQPVAIEALSDGVMSGVPAQTLLGVTGSGKTFTVANVIQNVERPVLVLSHNKTLAAQLYGEFKAFFPNNAVEYFVSYYDYYQPEAYLPSTNTYIEKDLSINNDIEKLRMQTTTSLLSGRRDVIVVSSVSCLYGMANPEDFEASTLYIKQGQKIGRDTFLRQLVDSLYSRNEANPGAGNFRVKGDTVDIYLAYGDTILRVTFWGDEIESIETLDIETGVRLDRFEDYRIYPGNLFVTTRERMFRAISEIEIDLGRQVEFLNSIGKSFEAKRLYERVCYDLEMLREVGYCSGIENYSRYFDNRKAGERPFCLLDYFPKDFLLVVDESHVTISQIRAMYGGDRSRKENLVEYGFRLPAALDNRPLTFEEFESFVGQAIYISATPADYELMKSEGVIVEQLIRPTGLIDPPIEVRPSLNQIDDLMEEIQQRIEKDERTLVITLTKRMAEEMTNFLMNYGVNTAYIHSDVDTINRVEIMEGLRQGKYDVLVGVNLLREGLDLPEVSLVAILDADKEGFLRSERALTQTAGRAARNVNGKVIFYADVMTDSMKKTIEESNRRRTIQMKYNEEHGIVPQQIRKAMTSTFDFGKHAVPAAYEQEKRMSLASEENIEYMSKEDLIKAIEGEKRNMNAAAKRLDFLEAAQYRDRIVYLENILKKKG
ncbi:excinuclease ABC subunit UvrB [Dysgonomonas sp. 25]|uniref:excinuclease ABC subunit UvrB n=1 Tax=Dysgonomonas sp. 25 TaxID=2302933 RepID=UPI0013CFFA78|nr:excinuclease ABC subunit UvrB [Dysgonomonas sp. 25]NDV69487.1 excinuclease ABC subunit UvrB [Dysgonomonas sp. 25]